MALRIVHAGGMVECYYMAIPAGTILAKYPAYVIAMPEVFRRPWDSVVRPEKIQVTGQKFHLVPRRTVKKLQRRIRKSSRDLSVSFVSQANYKNVSVDRVSHQETGSSVVNGSCPFSSAFKKTKYGIKKHVRFAGINMKHSTSRSEMRGIVVDNSVEISISWREYGETST